jgi:hypothetical protein
MAVCHAAKQLVWLVDLLRELNLNVETPTLFTDNMSCIALAKNPINHQRTKHINIRFHYTRDLIESNQMKLVFCTSEEQAADMLTKPAQSIVYETGKRLLNLH